MKVPVKVLAQIPNLRLLLFFTTSPWVEQPFNHWQQKWQRRFCHWAKASYNQCDSRLCDLFFSKPYACGSLPLLLESFCRFRFDRVSFVLPVTWDVSRSFCKCPNIWYRLPCWQIAWSSCRANPAKTCGSWYICVFCYSTWRWHCRVRDTKGNWHK